MSKITAASGFNPNTVIQIGSLWGKTQGVPALALSLGKLGLKDRGKLINSLKSKPRKRFGQLESIRFEFEFYGLFHNYGAENAFGKGVNLPARNWLAAGLNPQVEKLANMLGDYYGDVAVKNIQLGKKS